MVTYASDFPEISYVHTTTANSAQRLVLTGHSALCHKVLWVFRLKWFIQGSLQVNYKAA